MRWRRSRSPGDSGDRDLEFSAKSLLGEAYVASGRVADGMTLLDETMAAVSGGEVAGIGSIGEIYCRLFSACERAADVRRAEQWLADGGTLRRVDRLSRRRPAGRTTAGS